MAITKTITGWITVNGKHIPLFDGESSEDAYKRSIKGKAREQKAKKEAKQHKAEKSDKRDAMLFKYFKDLDPKTLDKYEKGYADDKQMMKQIAKVRKYQYTVKYYSSLPKDTLKHYIQEVNALPASEEKGWRMEGLKKNKHYGK